MYGGYSSHVYVCMCVYIYIYFWPFIYALITIRGYIRWLTVREGCDAGCRGCGGCGGGGRGRVPEGCGGVWRGARPALVLTANDHSSQSNDPELRAGTASRKGKLCGDSRFYDIYIWKYI